MESFTIHGLSKVFVGKMWERLFWGLVLLGVLGFLTFKVHGFYARYNQNEYRTEIRETDEYNRTWPAIEVCCDYVAYALSLHPFGESRYDFCYKNYSFHKDIGKTPCHRRRNYIYPLVNSHFQLNYMYPTMCVNFNISDLKKDWNNVFMEHFAIDKEAIQSSSNNDFGFSVKVEGDPIAKSFKFGQQFSLIITNVKTINRLSFPFQSNCSNGENGLNVFPPPYTRDKCKHTLFFYKLLENCGDVPDHWQQYVQPHHTRGRNNEWKNQTHENVLMCMYQLYTNKQAEYLSMTLDLCPLPCKEIVTESKGEQISKNHIQEDESTASIMLTIPSSRITKVNEIASYTSDDFLADIGSWLGLLVGMSLLSIVEIVAFTFTVVKERCS